MQPPQPLDVLLPRAAEAEAAADEDRPVAARQVELVHRLRVQVRREPLARRRLAAVLEHVGRDVAAVDVEPGAEIGSSSRPVPQATSSAGCPASTKCRK